MLQTSYQAEIKNSHKKLPDGFFFISNLRQIFFYSTDFKPLFFFKKKNVPQYLITIYNIQLVPQYLKSLSQLSSLFLSWVISQLEIPEKYYLLL